MGRRSKLLGMFLTFTQIFILAIVMSLTHSQAKVAAAGSIDISGTVTNQSGVGLAGVSVYATDPAGNTVDFGPTDTASDGSYDLMVDTGDYDIHFVPNSGSGLGPIVDSSVMVFSDQTIDIALSPATNTISGIFTDTSGNPISNALLVFTGAGSAVATTDANGFYSVNVTPGQYDVGLRSYSGDGLGSVALNDGGSNFVVDATNGNVTQNLQFNTATVKVVVNDSNGNPVPNAQVNVNPTGGATSLLVGQTGSWVDQGSNSGNDPSGTDTLGVLQGLTYQVCGTDPVSGAFACTPVTITGSSTTVDITTPATNTISGIFTDTSGNPISNALLVFTGAGSAVATTDANGFYSVNVTPGQYDVGLRSYSGDGLGSVALNDGGSNFVVDATNGNVTQNLQFNTATVKVVVNDSNGNPVPNAQVNVNPTGGATSLLVGQTGSWVDQGSNSGNDPSGTDTLGVLQGLTYQVCGTDPVSGAFACTPVTITGSSTTVDITTPATNTISGIFTDTSGNPISNALLVFTGAGSAVATTDANGFYSVNVTPGQYDVGLRSYSGDGLGSVALNDGGSNFVVDATNGNVTQNLQFNTATVKVVVNDSNGNPVPNAQVNVNPTGGATSLLVGQTGSWVDQGSNSGNDPSGTDTLGVLQGLTYQVCGTDPVSGAFACTPVTITGSSTTVIIQQQPQQPTPPTNLSAPSPAQNPSLSWNSVTGATSYNIYRNGTKIDSSTTNSYTDTSAPEGTDSYYVTAVNTAGESSPSNTVNVVVDQTAPTITYTVTPVADSNGYNTGNVLVTFTCTDNSGGSGIASCTSPVTVDNEGIGHVVSGSATDNAGNTSMINVNPSLLNTAINAGGDNDGAFTADSNFTGGSTYTSTAAVDTSNVTSPAPQSVYQTVRYGNTMTYTFPGLTPNSNYTLMLHFNELYWGTPGAGGGGVGSRVFNVAVNGQSALSNYDIYKQAGGANKAITEQVAATADSNGNVTVTFTSVTDNAMVSGLELFNGVLPPQVPDSTPPPATSALIAAGSTTNQGSFVADTDYTGGSTYTSSASVDTSGVTNPAPEAVYQSNRYGNFTYSIPNLTPNTNFQVRLHFNEPYWGLNGNGGTGSRLFNVAINGTQVLNNFDIYATAGGANKALAEDFTATSDSNGKITIQFTSIQDNAMVSGIEVDASN